MTDRTHAEDCHEWGPAHHACAVARIERLEAVCGQALKALESNQPAVANEAPHADVMAYNAAAAALR